MSIADIIAQQIGQRAFFMMGARNFQHTKNGLMFSCMLNGKGVRSVEVRLDPSDTYTVVFRSLRGQVVAEVADVYVESLHGVIESNTGLYLSL